MNVKKLCMIVTLIVNFNYANVNATSRASEGEKKNHVIWIVRTTALGKKHTCLRKYYIFFS